jgi:hypothetical protein
MEEKIASALLRYQKAMEKIREKRDLLDSEERRLARDLFSILNQNVVIERGIDCEN